MNDALGYTRMLEEAGDTREKAEATVRIVKQMIGENYITENDLEIFSIRLDGKFSKIESDMDSRFAQVDSRFKELQSEMDSRFTQVDSQFRELKAEMNLKIDSVEDRLKVSMMKYLTVFLGLGLAIAKLIF